jgi:hypothetical protein
MTVWKKTVERKQKAAFADHLKAEKWYQEKIKTLQRENLKKLNEQT